MLDNTLEFLHERVPLALAMMVIIPNPEAQHLHGEDKRIFITITPR